jgi:DNA-directed RNA polymerase subunit beta'
MVKRDDHGVILNRDGEIHLLDEKNRVRARYNVPYAATIRIKDKSMVSKGDVLFEWDPYTNTIISEHSGRIQFVDLIEDVSFREELDETTGLRQRVIVEQREKNLRPRISILDDGGKKIATYSIPTRSYLLVHPEDKVESGDILVKMPRELSKTGDITGGLPRVAELFEARKPKDPAVVSEIDGEVEFGKIIRGSTQIFVKGETEEKEYLIPHGKHLRVHSLDMVTAGDRLCEGPIDPHDILRIKGPNAVQEYLVNEIQEVYRLQGVRINDRHIEVIVRQMLQKVKVEDIGSTNFLEGEQVDKNRFKEENERVIAEGGEPATFQPLLLGITKASLTTDSFISAASFQETTRVLTEAAISGKTDYLLGLKENVIIGHLIPAGTGLERYRSVQIRAKEEEEKEEEELEAIEEKT